MWKFKYISVYGPAFTFLQVTLHSIWSSNTIDNFHDHLFESPVVESVGIPVWLRYHLEEQVGRKVWQGLGVAEPVINTNVLVGYLYIYIYIYLYVCMYIYQYTIIIIILFFQCTNVSWTWKTGTQMHCQTPWLFCFVFFCYLWREFHPAKQQTLFLLYTLQTKISMIVYLCVCILMYDHVYNV